MSTITAPTAGKEVRALMEAAQRVLDGGYVSEHIEEERGDHLALKRALAALSSAPPAVTSQSVGRDEMVRMLNQLATKQEGYGHSFYDGRDGASLNLYGERARAAVWLFKNAERIAAALAEPASPPATAPIADLVARCTAIADAAVPMYRGGKARSCTGHYARQWQATWDGACLALGGNPAEFRR